MRRLYLLLLILLFGGVLCACDSGTATPKGAPDEVTMTALPDGSPPPNIISPIPRMTTLPNGGLTLKEGYALAAPMIKAWQADAVLIAAFNDENNGMDATGHATLWYFQAVSPFAGKRHTWQVQGDPTAKTGEGKGKANTSADEDIGKDAAKTQAARLLPLDQVIDTDKVMEIARQNGANYSSAPVGIYFTAPTQKGDPLSYNLLFQDGADVLRVRVDAKTGALLSTEKG